MSEKMAGRFREKVILSVYFSFPVCSNRSTNKRELIKARYRADTVSGDKTWQKCSRLIDDNKASGNSMLNFLN